ncbi:MAG TPA: alpha/beta fold hydrolase [Candidatus Hydrogenedentes bacterium]|nr:alpha/beta fold hydrolase [Candidatus Hydrogenedentota bacterium]
MLEMMHNDHDGKSRPAANKGRRFVAAAGVYALALIAMKIIFVAGIERRSVRIDGPGGKPCLGTAWIPPSPKAAIVIGHGVTANRGYMAVAANAFARNGYAVAAIDFWGHGRSRERFDWPSNGDQVKTWCRWVRTHFEGLPLAYLGHSMGGAAGDAAFRDETPVEAFVSMGMLPRNAPACRTLIAMGQFEELFSVSRAREVAKDKADVLASPFSDHMLEPFDPLLIKGIMDWTGAALGLDTPGSFPWFHGALLLMAVLAGCSAAMRLAEQAASFPTPPQQAPGTLPMPGRFNAFRIAAWAAGCKGIAAPPRSGSLYHAILRGVVFGLALVLLLSWLLTDNVYTCSLNHPERLLMWIAVTPIFAGVFFLTTSALERNPLRTAFQRFAVGALTRAVPLFAGCAVLALMGHGIAFAGMMLGILALVLIFISAVHALATRGAGDYRSGIVASGIVLAWITAFWFPLTWVSG